ncbi:hypothetical protein [Sedimenticola selenatireducens]|uniref:hypothetical protein n=1 Tax=Sedimenticola selenatireducens TaxID=191960 RepID=UPI00048D896B|nr:hypothetical protein [Sedimenticola selenatireducens]
MAPSSIIWDMKKHTTITQEQRTGVGTILRKAGVFTIGLLVALTGVLRELFVSMEIQHDEERRPHDSDLTGELNHRTGRLDAGTDPDGWYEEDM